MLKVKDLMTRELLTLAPNTSIREAAEILATEHVSGAPVVHAGKPLGMVSARDLLEFIAALPADPEAVSGGMEHGILDDHTVEEAMTRGPLTTVSPETPASRAAELMQAERIHRLPVVEDGRLVGIITTTDIVKAVADRKLSYRTFVFP
ncbi:CBS domain-containing protein [Pseudogemmatithrix spongiicola]|uniref:CBS domain-containing protein n=1 Tax=Pseudogemmatithrix spongiicola TaxID=3062599 RepID=A0AA49JYT4_9BACT|nr:CBS domain-containing protein [Gemmatimonadaceae bacterium 'strain 138']WKW14755.1 CBS domain-containing protein [Gemmatimonadaceae bacterium 'strain 318']